MKNELPHVSDRNKRLHNLSYTDSFKGRKIGMGRHSAVLFHILEYYIVVVFWLRVVEGISSLYSPWIGFTRRVFQDEETLSNMFKKNDCTQPRNFSNSKHFVSIWLNLQLEIWQLQKNKSFCFLQIKRLLGVKVLGNLMRYFFWQTKEKKHNSLFFNTRSKKVRVRAGIIKLFTAIIIAAQQ